MSCTISPLPVRLAISRLRLGLVLHNLVKRLAVVVDNHPRVLGAELPGLQERLEDVALIELRIPCGRGSRKLLGSSSGPLPLVSRAHKDYGLDVTLISATT